MSDKRFISEINGMLAYTTCWEITAAEQIYCIFGYYGTTSHMYLFKSCYQVKLLMMSYCLKFQNDKFSLYSHEKTHLCFLWFLTQNK